MLDKFKRKTGPPRKLGPLSPRSRAAIALGVAARTVSKSLGRGAGGMVGGRVAMRIDPDILAELTEGRRVILVTGTNGKSTTTRMLVSALKRSGPVVANLGGDNMESGVITALMSDLNAPVAVLEVDELNLPVVAAATKPEMIVLTNLSADQLDRVGDVAHVENQLRRAVNMSTQATVVANSEDPLVVSAAWDARKVIWVAAGTTKGQEVLPFPRTGSMVRPGPPWSVEGSALYEQPEALWWFETHRKGMTLHGPEGVEQKVRLKLPGVANQGNAALAIVAAVTMGAQLKRAAGAVKKVTGVSGRYQTYDYKGRLARLLLAKNPAGWQHSLRMIPQDVDQVVVSVNAERGDGRDLSWLWEVDFHKLVTPRPRKVIVSGRRAADVAVRLSYAGVDAEIVDDPLEAVLACEPGEVEVLANYTAFQELRKELGGGGK